MPFPLPDPRCALTAPFHPCCPSLAGGERFVLCGTVPGVAPAGCYPAPYVDGARTFLPRSLSTVAGAAVRPTDAPRHGGFGPPGQADNGLSPGQNKLFFRCRFARPPVDWLSAIQPIKTSKRNA